MLEESNCAKEEELNKKKECLLGADKGEVQQFEVIIGIIVIVIIILKEYYNGCSKRCHCWVS